MLFWDCKKDLKKTLICNNMLGSDKVYSTVAAEYIPINLHPTCTTVKSNEKFREEAHCLMIDDEG